MRGEIRSAGGHLAGATSSSWASRATLVVGLAMLAACGSGSSGSSGDEGGSTTPPPATSDCSSSTTSFDSTFDGIQQEIFQKHGCTDDLCHGSSKQGGLQLTADVSYENLIQVHSTESEFNRVEPGDQNQTSSG
jgi:hypothetical protein